ncbi:hypothetical protein KIPB_001647 [Kipferlia bialata]|uniref:EF-hand domain-containing protein n=1 Tax=Kipferlia bialata TaxID=797122 RepID=A0A9K3CP59_9EUKA|nr:hypothetical protein KIPB_001647 [Kipferlia bialata]|eukprot:g1647.t1
MNNVPFTFGKRSRTAYAPQPQRTGFSPETQQIRQSRQAGQSSKRRSGPTNVFDEMSRASRNLCTAHINSPPLPDGRCMCSVCRVLTVTETCTSCGHQCCETHGGTCDVCGGIFCDLCLNCDFSMPDMRVLTKCIDCGFQLPMFDRRDVEQIFRRYDALDRGSISVGQTRQALSSMGVPRAIVDRVMARMSDDQALSLPIFRRYCSKTGSHSTYMRTF